jgi:hypothetical protein
MWFAGRNIPEAANSVDPGQLVKGQVFFSVTFLDDALCLPELVPVVFIGNSSDELIFRYASAASDTGNPDAEFGFDGELSSIYTFEVALEIVLACSIRRSASLSS